MDVRERLRRLEQLHRRSVSRVLEGVPHAVPDTIAWGLEERLPGFIATTPAGECFVAEASFPLDYQHGQVALGTALEVGSQARALLGRDTALAEMDLRRMAFVDTETTGLAGGSGTYAFLVGLGFFDGDRFVVRQYFMRDFAQEEAMLQALDTALSCFAAWGSFNGKSFDLPLLETRFILNGVRRGLEPLPHLDLLFPARRLLRGRFDSFRLSFLETDYLGVSRDGDVPGALVPQLYFEFLRSRRPELLVPVFYHNSQDILSLVTLTAALGRRFDAPEGGTTDDPVELANLGRSYEAAGLPARATACYERAVVELELEASPLLAHVRSRLAMVYKRGGHWGQAITLWESLAAEGGIAALEALVELAKYHEHRSQDFPSAIQYAMRAREIAAGLTPKPALNALQHRLARLRRKEAPRIASDDSRH